MSVHRRPAHSTDSLESAGKNIDADIRTFRDIHRFMSQTIADVWNWFRTHEWLAIWLEGIALVALFGLRVPGISLQIAQQRRLVLPCQDRIPTQRFAKTVPSLPAQTGRSLELRPSRLQTSNSWEHLLLSTHQQAHQRPSDSHSPTKELRPQHQLPPS